MTTTVRQAWFDAQGRIKERLMLDAVEARLESQLLLQYALNTDRAWLIAHENDALGANIHGAFEASVNRRLNGEPIAHILGKREFYGLEFTVTPDTLIPRPDTETLVEAALGKIPAHRPCAVLDLGTGTGAIAIAIASQRPQSQITAVDASAAALAVAQANARNLNISHVEFTVSDWFSALQGKTFDVIVSNPPYIADGDPHLTRGDLRFEPASALAAGKDGLDCIKHIISEAGQHLSPQGWLMLEHGYDQAEKVATLLVDARFGSVIAIPDLSGTLRVTSGRLR